MGCMGNLEGRTPQDFSSEAAKAELDTFQKTLWCLACYCCYTGYSYDINPICSQDGKLCCCYINVESAYCCWLHTWLRHLWCYGLLPQHARGSSTAAGRDDVSSYGDAVA